MTVSTIREDLTLHPDMAGALLTPEEFDAAEIDPDDGLGRVPSPRADMATIVVEFVSRGRRNRQRDYVEKRREYEAAGVREYWVIDRFRRVLTACGRRVSRSGERTIAEGEVYTTKLLPGFELPLARLLAAADAWSK